MKALRTILPAFLAASPAAAHIQKQTVLGASGRTKPLGVGHFSEWSRSTKKAFLVDWQAGNASEWTIVAGNEGGDLDSMTSALTWAYHLEHSTENTSHPIKAIALLQTPSHALDLRPENQLALDNSQMTPGHEDLLTMDELPEDPETLSRKMKGIVLVDHGEPLRKWSHAKILSIFDHHKDRGTAPDAEPRIFETAASCTTLVARQMLDELEKLDQEYHMPHELLELVLSAIAIDSGGLTSDKTTKEDIKTSKRILARSAWAKKDLEDVMEDLDDQLSKAQKKIDGLGLRDLLRRDWKGDLVDTPSPRTPTVSLGFASVPYSMDEQVLKTDFAELFDWFAVHAVRILSFYSVSLQSNPHTLLNRLLTNIHPRPGPPNPASTSPSP
jgi:exopolyphosphatase